jgi:C4-dicarboxylate-specific signal transduction histidine kinase
MESILSEINHLLKYEVVEKGRAPAIFFGLFGIFIFYYGFNCTEYEIIIKASAALVVVLSILRFLLINKIQQKKKWSPSSWWLLKVNIWMHIICWAVIFTTASYELKFNGIHFIVLTTMLCGFTSGALITLSTDLSLFVLFQFFLLAPQVFIMSLDALTVNQYGVGPLVPVYFLHFAYQLRQVKDFRRRFIEKVKFQIELKERNDELIKIQQDQNEQTVKLIHTSRMAALGEMAAGIAHEINNPLMVISGNLQQIERKITRANNAEAMTWLKHTASSLQAINRVTKIINGLRLFSQQSDNLPRKNVSLNVIIEETLSFCGEMLKARYVRLEVENIPDVIIECHSVQISQVLINIIKNAEDAVKSQEDEHRWVKLRFEMNNQAVLIHLSNGGTKIAKEITDKLFLPFFTTKPLGEGTGLGLSISKGIMHEHGGDLKFNEIENQTTFTISLLTV